MGQLVLDYLMVIIAIAVSWSYRPHPPQQDDVNELDHGLPSFKPTSAGAIGMDRPSGSPASLASVLQKICTASKYPSNETFLQGARESYETITRAFASGQIQPHAYLLSDTVRKTFAEAILARVERGETCELTFIGFRDVQITDAALEGCVAQISVQFRSYIVSTTRDVLGKVVAGDPLHVVEVSEVWTFERKVPSNTPHWVLVGSGACD